MTKTRPTIRVGDIVKFKKGDEKYIVLGVERPALSSHRKRMNSTKGADGWSRVTIRLASNKFAPSEVVLRKGLWKIPDQHQPLRKLAKEPFTATLMLNGVPIGR